MFYLRFLYGILPVTFRICTEDYGEFPLGFTPFYVK